MGPVHVWDLNLDAEYELQTRSSYTRSRAAAGFVARHAASARVVLGEGDLTLEEVLAGATVPTGARGRAWCPTPTSRARLAAAGIELEPAPSLEVLRRVNDRGFCAELGQTLPGGVYARSLAPLLATLARGEAPVDWLAKRAFGVAGRARRKLERGSPSDAERAWLVASLRLGGVQLEPFVEIAREYTIHGEVLPGGDWRVGVPRVQRCDEQGAWLETRDARPDELSARDELELGDAARRAAAALSAAGYFGPFGLDAFTYHWPGSSELRLQPASEINARYTLGWVRPAAN